jgi:triosephosphate isomerase (TIM)
MKKMLIAGNWKMNTTGNEARELTLEIKNGIFEREMKTEILICPPFVNIPLVSDLIKDTNIHLGAQNCSPVYSGAFTGEISIPMLQYYNCSYIIVAHSERRQLFGETDETANKKVIKILTEGMNVILCIGETIDERNSGNTYDVLESQLRRGLEKVDKTKTGQIIIAYEPVWAIGTGVSAKPEQVQEAHSFIRNTLNLMFEENSRDMIIQYGGSVNGKNALEILSLSDVNGALIGGASLKADEFLSIISMAEEIMRN